MGHYIVLSHYRCEYDEDVQIYGVFHSLSAATEKFKIVVQCDKEFAEKYNYDIEDDSDMDFFMRDSEGVDFTRTYIQFINNE